MLQISNQTEGKPLLHLPSVADLTVAQELKGALQSALAQGAGLAIDATEVERITTPCLQVLAAGSLDFARAGGPALSFTDASPSFSRAVSSLGLGDVLRLPETKHE